MTYLLKTGKIHDGTGHDAFTGDILICGDVCLYMTDAWVEPHGVQNPAIYDCFPNSSNTPSTAPATPCRGRSAK